MKTYIEKCSPSTGKLTCLILDGLGEEARNNAPQLFDGSHFAHAIVALTEVSKTVRSLANLGLLNTESIQEAWDDQVDNGFWYPPVTFVYAVAQAEMDRFKMMAVYLPELVEAPGQQVRIELHSRLQQIRQGTLDVPTVVVAGGQEVE